MERQIQEGRGEGERLIDPVQNQFENCPLAKVAGHLRARVVSAEFLLVDVFLEDVAEHVGIDFVGLTAGRVVEIPRVAAKEIENVLKRAVGNDDARLVGEAVIELDMMRQDQAAVEVADFSEQGVGFRAAGGFGFGETFKEQCLQEYGIEFVRAQFLATEIKFVRQVTLVAMTALLAVIEKEVFWRNQMNMRRFISTEAYQRRWCSSLMPRMSSVNSRR